MDLMLIPERNSIYIDLLITNLNFITGDTDNTFDIILASVKREPENDDIAALRVTDL